MITKVYSTFIVKDFDTDARIIHGIASTLATDRMSDVVEPRGARFKLPLPLLWQHDAGQPIGHVTQAHVSDEGISITAQLAKTSTAGTLRERLDEAWESIKLGLVRGLSIGFRSLRDEPLDGYGRRFTLWEWIELSAVTIPANAEANIATVKALTKAMQTGTRLPDGSYRLRR